MKSHSFSTRQLAAIALMLDEEEKIAALSDKKSLCWFTGVSEAEAFEVRDKFKQYFNSPRGSVPWQNERCNVRLI
jgi:hypothetical protein